jgi:hypothetical protein
MLAPLGRMRWLIPAAVRRYTTADTNTSSATASGPVRTRTPGSSSAGRCAPGRRGSGANQPVAYRGRCSTGAPAAAVHAPGGACPNGCIRTLAVTIKAYRRRVRVRRAHGRRGRLFICVRRRGDGSGGFPWRASRHPRQRPSPGMADYCRRGGGQGASTAVRQFNCDVCGAPQSTDNFADSGIDMTAAADNDFYGLLFQPTNCDDRRGWRKSACPWGCCAIRG